MSELNEEDQPKWNRYLAATTNNLAWDLSTKSRTALEDKQMLNAAHASAYHWSLIGTELNDMRAIMLLAEVHALLGFGPSAYAYAQHMKTYFTSHDTPDWELAFTHTIYAHAAYVNGELAEHASSYAEAKRAIDEIAEDNERVIVVETFNHVPKPNA